ncbi:MAG: carboxypeptidase-like regulatory domain-containing protein [Bacteroidota bacterium]
MKFFLFCVILLFSITAGFNVYCQDAKRTITGIVTSFEESSPLEGVRVAVKGSNNNSGTQADGIYYINISPRDSILVFSLPGYETKEVAVTKSNEYNVSLRAGKSDIPLLIVKEVSGMLTDLYFRCWLFTA